MPNWNYNEGFIYADKDNLNKIKDFLSNGENCFSFQKIIPMPKILDFGDCPIDEVIVGNAKAWAKKTNAVLNNNAISVFRKYSDIAPSDILDSHDDTPNLAKVFFDAISETGYLSWYDWRRDNWGTKWDTSNACLVSENDGELFYTYDTAWVCAIRPLLVLSEKFPSASIIVRTISDECYEENGAEEFSIQNGEIK